MVEHYELDAPLSRWTESRFAAFLARIDEVRAMDVAWDLRGTAAANAIPQAIVSNGPRPNVRAHVERLGLSPDKVLTISRDDVANGKPAPDPYLLGAVLSFFLLASFSKKSRGFYRLSALRREAKTNAQG
jgi:beta-phosphoglucomutase-like phosphatase (HAD superfamily)